MKKGRRIIALLLAVLLLATSDTNLYQVLATDTAQQSDQKELSADDAKGGENQDNMKDETQGNTDANTGGAADGTGEKQDTSNDTWADESAAPAADGSKPQTYSPTEDNSTAQPQAAAPAVKEADKTFTMEAKAEFNAGETSLYSGESFNYKLSYSVPPLASGSEFANPQIVIPIPENLSVDMSAKGIPVVEGNDVENCVLRQGGRILYIYLSRKMTTSSGKTITIKLNTTNFVMKSGTVISLNPTFTAEANSTKYIGTIPEDKREVTTIQTDDLWNVEKTTSTPGPDPDKTKDHYEVEYELKVQNTDSSGNSWDRTGRLDMEDFSLTDVLPTNYAAGGGARNVHVYIGSTELTKGTDYTTTDNTDGSVKDITIHKINKTTESMATDYVPEGKPIPTTYTVRMEYPYAPYETAADSDLVKWNLTNTAKLHYKLLGDDPQDKEATAEVILGHKAKPGQPQKINVQKLVKFTDSAGGEVLIPIGDSASEYGDAEFELYRKNKDGVYVLANNVDGSDAAGSSRKTDGKGRVTFSNLPESTKLPGGTYYLKETEFLNNFDELAADKYVEVAVDNAGILSLGATNGYEARLKDNTVQIINTTSKLGVVEFYKRGTSAEGLDEPLSNVTFQLVSNTEPTVYYNATSVSDGLVRFPAVSAGTYALKETGVGSNSDYDVSTKMFPVTVEAGKIIKPDLSGSNTFRNTSAKGKLKIQKINDTTVEGGPKAGLAGAEFEVYGPYLDHTSLPPADASPAQTKLITGDEGYATSKALRAGWYVLKEVKAPEGYTIKEDSEYTHIEVTAGQIAGAGAPTQIVNEKLVRFTIKKTGTLGSALYEEQLAGAKFNIYDSETGGTLLGTLTTYLDGTHGSTSNPLLLKQGGTYWYEEIEAPEGYTVDLSAGRTAITIPQGETEYQITVRNVATYGQLKLTKKDSHSKGPLKGAVFGVYVDKDALMPYKKGAQNVTMTTGADGVGLSPLLPANQSFYVKEITAAGGYVTSDTIYGPLTVLPNAQTEVKASAPVLNDKGCSILITKKDSEKTELAIPGVTFALYTDETGNIQAGANQVTNESGECTFTGLKPKTMYWYEEISCPEGYVLESGRKSVTTPDYAAEGIASVTENVTNVRKATLKIYKTTNMDVSGVTPVPMEGVSFNIYEVDRDAEFVETSATLFGKVGPTGPDGYTPELTGLNPGKDYYAVEILSEEDQGGYAPTPVKIQLEAGNLVPGYASQDSTIINNSAVNGRIEVKKVSSLALPEGNKAPVEAVFDVYAGTYSTKAELAGKDVAASITTDKVTGIGISGWLAEGAYTVVERSATGEYTLSDTLYNVTVERKKTNKVHSDTPIENVPQGRITMNKQAAYSVTDGAGKRVFYPLSGMTFRVYKKVSENFAADKVLAGALADSTLTTPMVENLWTSKALDAGWYWIEEEVPSGEPYVAITPFAVEVKPGETVAASNGTEEDDKGYVVNQPNYGKIRIFKRDIATNNLLDDARFELYQQVGEGEGGTNYAEQGGPDVYLKKITDASTSQDGSKSGNLVTGTGGSKGTAVTTNIAPGTYYLKEVKEPDGYHMIDEWTGPVTVASGEENQQTIYNYTEASQEGEKTDNGGRPLGGAWVGAFETSVDAQNMLTWLKAGNVGTGNPKPGYSYTELKNKINQEEFRKEHNIVSYGESDDTGKIAFTPAMIPSKSYYLMELLPPDGYLLNETIFERMIEDDGSFQTPLAIQNASGSQIKAYKYTKLTPAGSETASEYPVEGVTFYVYKAKADVGGEYEKDGATYSKDGDKVAEGVTDAAGNYYTIFLPEGTYIIEEDQTNLPDYVEWQDGVSTPYQIVTIADGEKKNGESPADARFYNPSARAAFLVIKVDQADVRKALSAVFEVYKKNDAGEYKPYYLKGASDVYTITTKADGTYTESVFLPAGDYALREKTAPEHYTALAAFIPFTLTAGQKTYVKDDSSVSVNTDDDVSNDVVTNVAQGSLELEKYGYFREDKTGEKEEEERLGGFTFALYKRTGESAEADCAPGKTPVVADIQTKKDQAVTVYADAGDYWLIETASGDAVKYPLSPSIADRVTKVTLTAGATTSLTKASGESQIANYTAYGRIRLKKVDAVSESGLLDAVFGVYTDAGATRPLTVAGKDVIIKTAAEGIGLSKPIPTGSYYIKETTAPTGYAPDSTIRSVTVETSRTTDLQAAPFKDGKKYKIQIKKENNKTPATGLPGAVFALYKTEAEAIAATNTDRGTPVDVGTTASDGTWTTKELILTEASATYYLKELKAPDGYVQPDSALAYPVTVTHDAIKDADTPTLTALPNTTVTNIPLGRMMLKKEATWQGLGETEEKTVLLSGVRFDLYKVSAENADYHTGTYAGSLKTDANGEADSDTGYKAVGDTVPTKLPLQAGWYAVVENVPDGYDTRNQDVHWVEISNDTPNRVLFDTPVMNYPNKGKFMLYKFDGSKDTPVDDLTGLSGAKFVLYKQNESGDYEYAQGTKEKSTFTMEKEEGFYESGMLDPGDYQIVEIEAPTAKTYTYNGTEYSIEFKVDPTPIPFVIGAGATVRVEAHNSPKGRIQLTKVGDDANGNELINTAKFQLYQMVAGKKVVLTKEVDSVSNGVYTWEQMNPGTYYIEEIASEAMDNEGWGINATPIEVTVSEGRTVEAVQKPEDLNAGAANPDDIVAGVITMKDDANKGRLRIWKQDLADNTPLSGAEFEIYARDEETGSGWSDTPIDTVTIAEENKSAGQLSSLLPAAAGGTHYLVKETKAPEGYSLDDSLFSLTQEVLVKPLHTPAVDISRDNNVQFRNQTKDSITGFGSTLKKMVKENISNQEGASKDELEYAEETTAGKSLLNESYTVDYKIDGYADGSNLIGAKSFVIQDNKIALFAAGGTTVEERSSEPADYQMNTLQILPATNESADEKVGAEIYVQYTPKQKVKDEWVKLSTLDNLEDLTEGKLLRLTQPNEAPVIGVKVCYTNVKKGFVAAGLVINVTFAERNWSTKEDNEVRKIVNTASLSWEDLRTDADGNPDPNTAEDLEYSATSLIPSASEVIPQVSIKNEVVNEKSMYYAGDEVNYRVTVTNHEIGKDAPFEQAVVSVKMPAFTPLNEDKAGTKQGFKIYKKTLDGRLLEIDPVYYTRVDSPASAALKDSEPSGENSKYDATLYTFAFADDPLTTLCEGEEFVFEFSGVVSYERTSEITRLVSPAYLSSNKLVPPTVENPKGLTFESSTDVGQPLEDGSKDQNLIDTATGEDLSYLNSNVGVSITDSHAVQISKEVSSDGTNYSSLKTAHVNPAGTIYYRITLHNLSEEKLKKASIVDSFPIYGDTYVKPGAEDGDGKYENRGTTIPEGAKVTFKNVAAQEGATAAFYYYNGAPNAWTAAGRAGDMTGKLAMLYDRAKMNDWESCGWSSASSDDTTAVGAQISFGGDGLEAHGTYTITLELNAPGYTADEIEAYYGKVMANSSAASVVRSTETNPDSGAISISDRVEASRVLADMKLPTGAIGDYVWFDANSNGIQDDGSKAGVEGVEVDLYRTKKTAAIDSPRSEKVATTKTNQNGKYQFDKLACNYLKKDRTEGSIDPLDYVGEVYYTYTVQFHVPPEYSVTRAEVGADREGDSNTIDASGNALPVTLNVTSTAGGTLAGGQDLSIDMGLIKAYSIGDRVWLDTSEQNGLQDAGEPGVAGVPVFLYEVGGPNEKVAAGAAQIDTTKTDASGKYSFDSLPTGYYVVRFDISNLRKSGGYAYRYSVTKANAAALDPDHPDVNNMDSDAKYAQDEDSMIMDTRAIDLSEAGLKTGTGLTGAEKENRMDSRWDMGLIPYSAISGFCFDDRDYTDTQSVPIPLAGTTVELYRLKADGTPEANPVDQTTVGSDGRYFFDNLVFETKEQKYTIKFTYPDEYQGVEAFVGADPDEDSNANVYPNTSRAAGYRQVAWISDVTVAQDSIVEHQDAGARKYAAVGDYVWVDANRNGVQDSWETPIPNVRVILQERDTLLDGTISDWQFMEETKTDAKGKYQFLALKSSDEIKREYRVVFALDRFTEITTYQTGSNSGADSDANGTYQNDIIPALAGGTQKDGGFVTNSIKPGYGAKDMTWDAGIYHEKVSLGDYVWYDDDHDGMQQAEEEGVANTGVILEYNPTGATYQENAWIEIARTQTDASGHYLFADLNPGYYRVKFQAPDGYRQTRYNRGSGSSGSAVDSDAARADGNGWYRSRSFYLDTDDMTWDAGFYKPQTRTERKRIYRTTRKPRSRSRRSVRTGDEAGLIPWIAVATAALAAAGGSVCYRRKKKKKESSRNS